MCDIGMHGPWLTSLWIWACFIPIHDWLALISVLSAHHVVFGAALSLFGLYWILHMKFPLTQLFPLLILLAIMHVIKCVPSCRVTFMESVSSFYELRLFCSQKPEISKRPEFLFSDEISREEACEIVTSHMGFWPCTDKIENKEPEMKQWTQKRRLLERRKWVENWGILK